MGLAVQEEYTGKTKGAKTNTNNKEKTERKENAPRKPKLSPSWWGRPLSTRA